MMAEGSRATRAFLVVLIVVLLALLCGLLYVLQSLMRDPLRQPTSADLPGVEFVFSAYGGDFDGGITRPIDVAYDAEMDRIYVTETRMPRVLVFDSDGTNGRVFVEDDPNRTDATSFADFTVITPVGVDVDDQSQVYVADPTKSAVVVFSPGGEKLREIAVMHPERVRVVGQRMYVANDSTLFVMDLAGNPLGQWGTRGRGVNELSDPSGIAVDEDGTIYLADQNNYRVIALSPDLEVLDQVGGAAVTEEEHRARLFASPSGLTLGPDGTLFMVDGLNSRVEVLDRATLDLISQPLGEQGFERDDQFYLPKSIDWMGEDLFVLADSFRDRIVGVRLNVVNPEDER